ncbi:MAG: hypothetical protein K1X94_09030 [Sandaracinaceae bacterium]|nr:hypothetical protein [Sandaracinaceae bacterium]
MTSFTGFSEAARLYAANEEIVDAMYGRLKADAVSYFDAVHGELRARLGPRIVELSNTSGYSYFRVRAQREGAELASVWVQRADGRLVRDAKVLVGFGMPLLAAQPNVLTPVVELVDQLATGPDGERVQRRKPTAATLFQIDVSVEGQDPVRAFCDRVAPVIESILTIVGKAPSGPF